MTNESKTKTPYEKLNKAAQYYLDTTGEDLHVWESPITTCAWNAWRGSEEIAADNSPETLANKLYSRAYGYQEGKRAAEQKAGKTLAKTANIAHDLAELYRTDQNETWRDALGTPYIFSAYLPGGDSRDPEQLLTLRVIRRCTAQTIAEYLAAATGLTVYFNPMVCPEEQQTATPPRD